LIATGPSKVTRILGIYVKYPDPGTVKTRLAADLGNERAAEMYRAFVSDSIVRFQTAGDRRFLCYSPATKEAEAWFEDLAGSNYELWPQPDGSLTPRLSGFFEFAHNLGAKGSVVIGSDSPTIPASFVDQAFEHLNLRDAVLGPATDGGYYLLGLRKPLPIFDTIDWSTRRVLRQTIRRLEQNQASLALLPPWYDVDTREDLDLLRGHLAALVQAGDPSIETLTHTRSVLGEFD
jgi:uncharacterized protein